MQTRSTSAGQDAARSHYIESAAAMVRVGGVAGGPPAVSVTQIEKFATEIIETAEKGAESSPR